MHPGSRMITANEQRDGLERIREILVGSIQRDLERKLARLEAQAATRVGELQQESRRRLDVIEAHFRTELDALSSRVSGELIEIKDALRALTRDHRETTAAGEQRIGRVEESVARAQHELRSQILDQAKSFLDELQHTREELTETLERELGELEVDTDEGDGRGQRSASGESQHAG